MKNLLIALSLLVGLQAEAAVQRRSYIEKTYTPGTGAGVTYSANDVVAMGGASTLSGVSIDNPGYATLWGLSVVDAEGKIPNADILFFNKAPVGLAADNAAFTADRATLLDDYVGKVRVATTDYVSGGTSQGSTVSVATVKDINLPLKTSTAGKLYAVMVFRDASTAFYGYNTSVKVKLLFGQE